MELKTYTAEELAKIIEKHGRWLADSDDPDGERANLRSANLTSANLRSANLRSADLRFANLTSANLRYANLRSANLTSANLRSANLTSADLRSANLTSADLRSADLRFANLTSANLRYANLRSANLTSADLSSTKNDLIAAILWLPDEIPFLRQAIVDGKIDGSTYVGDCACLAGTLCHAKQMDFDSFKSQKLMPIDAYSPREQWFTNMSPGHTPENSAVSRLTLEWVDEALSLVSRIRGVPAHDATAAVPAEGPASGSE